MEPPTPPTIASPPTCLPRSSPTPFSSCSTTSCSASSKSLTSSKAGSSLSASPPTPRAPTSTSQATWWYSASRRWARRDKLQPVKRGPFEVKEHVKNDVRAQHLHGTKEVVLSVETLEAFFAPRDLAERAAEIDDNQFKVEAVLAYEGDTEMRQGSKKARGCTVTVRFADGTVARPAMVAGPRLQSAIPRLPLCHPSLLPSSLLQGRAQGSPAQLALPACFYAL